MSELARLRMELKAEIELIAIRQGTMAQKAEEVTGRLEARMDQQAELLAELGRQMQLNSQDVARLGREMAAGHRWMEGRLRLLGGRFDGVLEAVHHDTAADHELLLELRERVERLLDLSERVERLEEQSRPPAA